MDEKKYRAWRAVNILLAKLDKLTLDETYLAVANSDDDLPVSHFKESWGVEIQEALIRFNDAYDDLWELLEERDYDLSHDDQGGHEPFVEQFLNGELVDAIAD